MKKKQQNQVEQEVKIEEEPPDAAADIPPMSMEVESGEDLLDNADKLMPARPS